MTGGIRRRRGHRDDRAREGHPDTSGLHGQATEALFAALRAISAPPEQGVPHGRLQLDGSQLFQGSLVHKFTHKLVIKQL